MKGSRVYLVQTDTTAGFLSQSAERLAAVKRRPTARPFLVALDSFGRVGRVGRVPEAHRAMVRRAKKSTFILPNGRSFRVVSPPHRDFVTKFGWLYSTSANRHGEGFDPLFAKEACDVVVESKQGFFETRPSAIWRLGRNRKVKIR
ncbi:Sua5 YciO YrdC YwlC family protein [Hydrogenimonas sp.]